MGAGKWLEQKVERLQEGLKALAEERITDPVIAALRRKPVSKNVPSRPTHPPLQLEQSEEERRQINKYQKLKRKAARKDRRAVAGLHDLRVSDLFEEIDRLKAENELMQGIMKRQADELRKLRKR